MAHFRNGRNDSSIRAPYSTHSLHNPQSAVRPEIGACGSSLDIPVRQLLGGSQAGPALRVAFSLDEERTALLPVHGLMQLRCAFAHLLIGNRSNSGVRRPCLRHAPWHCQRSAPRMHVSPISDSICEVDATFHRKRGRSLRFSFHES